MCTDIVLIESKQLHYFTGDYDAFLKKHAAFLVEQKKKAQSEHKELNKLQSSLAGGGDKASSKAGRKQMRERVDELKEKGTVVEKEYRVKFNFPAAARRLNPPLISMRSVAFRYSGAASDTTATAPPLFSNLNFELSMDSRVALVRAAPQPRAEASSLLSPRSLLCGPMLRRWALMAVASPRSSICSRAACPRRVARSIRPTATCAWATTTSTSSTRSQAA